MRAALAVTVLLGCLTSCSQDRRIAYPQSTLTFNVGTAIPLGADAKGDFVESRFQQLIPARYLPTDGNGELRSLQFVALSTGRVDYASLKIRFSLTAASQLSDDLEKNLPKPVTLLEAQNLAIDWKVGQWTEIPQLTPRIAAFDGQTNVVIDIQKVAKRLQSGRPAVEMAVSSSPGRDDLPSAKAAVGAGASTAKLAKQTLKYPVQIAALFNGNSPASLQVISDRLPSGTQNVFALGGTLELEVKTPWSIPDFVALVGHAPLQAPVRVPGVFGRLAIRPVAELYGSGRLKLGIPNSPSLVGQRFVFQALARWSPYVRPNHIGGSPRVVPRYLDLTNVVDCIVRP